MKPESEPFVSLLLTLLTGKVIIQTGSLAYMLLGIEGDLHFVNLESGGAYCETCPNMSCEHTAAVVLLRTHTAVET